MAISLWSQVAPSRGALTPLCTNLLTTIGSRQKRSEGDDAGVIVLEADVLLRRVADSDIPRRKIDARNAERREDRQFRPIGSGFNISPLRSNGANSRDEAPQTRFVEAALEGLAANRMIARRRIEKLQFDAAVQGSGPRRCLKTNAHVIQADSWRDFRNEADRALAGDRDVAAALYAGRQKEPGSDQRMFLSGVELGGISPEGFENGVRTLKRIDAKFRHAKIGRLAYDPDLAKKETHVSDIDIEHGRLDIDRHAWQVQSPRLY